MTREPCTPLFRRDWIRATVSPAQWTALGDFSAHGAAATPVEIAGATGIPEQTALAIVIALYASRLAATDLLVFHDCQDQPVAVRPFSTGFQPTPWKCKGCRMPVGADDLKYDTRTRPHGPITFG